MEKLATEIVSSLKDCLGQKEGKPLRGLVEPGPADIQPPQSRTPGGGGGTPLLRETLPRQGKPIGGP